MATAPTLYQRRLASRRATADIERLSKSYQTGMLDVTQKQQNAFKEWQSKSAEQMAPYQSAVKQYTSVDFPTYQEVLAKYNTAITDYETKASAYRQRLNEFQTKIEDIEKNPTELVTLQTKPGGKPGRLFLIDGQWMFKGQAEQRGYEINELVGKYYQFDGDKRTPIETKQAGRSGPRFLVNGEWLTQQQTQQRGVNIQRVDYEAQLVKERDVPTFTEEPPAAPSEAMPTAPTPPGEPPTIAGLDVAPFAKQRAELESSFKREVGERKAAKMNVAMRRMGRPMLQET